jgi:Lrp/AsnC family transcriptional regulator, regulator for asnA, asnC and gidA
MSSIVQIDEIDNKILHLLLKDAKLSLHEIAKECNLSSVSVLNRINRLKTQGVITGATLFASLSIYDFEIIAFLGIETENMADVQEILAFLKEYTFLIEPSLSIGKYDLHALIYAKDFNNLNERVVMVRRLAGIRKVEVSVWSGLPASDYANLDLLHGKR